MEPHKKTDPLARMRAQVVYRQGMVKDFIVPGSMTLSDFSDAVASFGKVKTLRSVRGVKDLALETAEAGVTVLG